MSAIIIRVRRAAARAIYASACYPPILQRLLWQVTYASSCRVVPLVQLVQRITSAFDNVEESRRSVSRSASEI